MRMGYSHPKPHLQIRQWTTSRGKMVLTCQFNSSQLKPKNKMVTVTSCLERQRKDGTSFAVLEISGGVELVQSQITQRYYATLRKCTIPFTGSIETAKMMIGQKIEGDIVRVICEQYEFVNPRTGEVMRLQHSYAYSQDSKQENLIGHTPVMEVASL